MGLVILPAKSQQINNSEPRQHISQQFVGKETREKEEQATTPYGNGCRSVKSIFTSKNWPLHLNLTIEWKIERARLSGDAMPGWTT